MKWYNFKAFYDNLFNSNLTHKRRLLNEFNKKMSMQAAFDSFNFIL